MTLKASENFTPLGGEQSGLKLTRCSTNRSTVIRVIALSASCTRLQVIEPQGERAGRHKFVPGSQGAIATAKGSRTFGTMRGKTDMTE